MTFEKVTDEFKQEFNKLVSESSNILITSHIHPDDDSIGSVLSTYYLIMSQFPDKNIKILYSQEFDQRWDYFQNFDQIQSVDDIGNHLSEFDLIIYLDSSQYSRFSDLPEKLAEFKKPAICIDHHKNPADKFDLLLQNPNSPAASELIYTALVKDLPKVDSKLAETLLLGILGDTGFLLFISPSQSYILNIVERLIREGEIDLQDLKSKYNSYPINLFTIIQELIKNTQFVKQPNYPDFMYTYISRQYMTDHKLTDLQISGAKSIYLFNFIGSINEASWGAVLTPDQEGNVSISLRSRPGSINCRMLMQEIGIGGGHDRAAGGKFESKDGSLLETDQALKIFMDWLKSHKPTLT